MAALSTDRALPIVRETSRNRTVMKAVLRRLDFADLERLRDHVAEAIEDKAAERAMQMQKERDTAAALDDVRALLEGKGISMEDMLQMASKQKAATPSQPSLTLGTNGRGRHLKYKCEIFGQSYLWDGMGHVPKPFKCYIVKHSADKEELLLPEEDWVDRDELDTRPYNAIPSEHKAEGEALLAQYQG